MRSPRRRPDRPIILLTISDSGNPRGIAYKFHNTVSGFFVAWGKQSQWQSLTEVMYFFKKNYNHLLNLLVSLGNFKIYWAQKIVFLKLKYTFYSLLDSVARGYSTTPLPFPPPIAPLQLPFAFRTLLIVPKISGEFFNNFGYKQVNFVAVVVIRTVTTVAAVTVDTGVTRTAMFSMVIIVTFWHSEDRASWYILIIKANKMHYFWTLFW